MSTALDTAIYKRLTGQENLTGYTDALAAVTALGALIAHEAAVPSGTGRWAVYNGVWQEGITMPCITFRASAGKVDNRSFQTSGEIDDVIYDFEYWDGPDKTSTSNKRADGTTPDGSRVSRIARQVELLMDMRSGIVPVLPLSSGKVFDMQSFVPVQNLFDKPGNLYFGLQRFLFKEARY